MSESKTFVTNKNLLIAPVIFFGAGIIVYNSHPDFILGYALPFTLGILFLTALTLLQRTYKISEGTIEIKSILKESTILVNDIDHYIKKTSFYRGNEMITWKLFMKDGRKISILTDYLKEPNRFKETLNWELKDVKGEEE